MGPNAARPRGAIPGPQEPTNAPAEYHPTPDPASDRPTGPEHVRSILPRVFRDMERRLAEGEAGP